MKQIIPSLILAITLGGCGDKSVQTSPDLSQTPGAAQTDRAPPEAPDTTSLPSQVLLPQILTQSQAEALGFPAGTLFDIGPRAGTPMAVVGVTYDDELNFRAAPFPQGEVVAKVKALHSEPAIYSAGQGWILERGGVWWNVSIDGKSVWANTRFLKSLGVPNTLNAKTVTGSMEDYVAAFAEKKTSVFDTAKVITVQPLEGLDAQGAVTTIDILGYQDDAVAGERFRIAFKNEVDATGQTLKIIGTVAVVTATPMCSRGITNGLCR